MFVRRSVLCLGLALSACGGEEVTTPPVTTPTEKYSTSAKILAYLEGKTFKMEGAAIPSHPNGFDEDVNFGSATQCYKSVAMTTNGGRVQITPRRVIPGHDEDAGQPAVHARHGERVRDRKSVV